jgi:5-methyltetrahydrofolate--homocysteine methyltransferase
MEELLNKLSVCIEFGRLNRDSKFPPNMLGMDGAIELTQQALLSKIAPQEILNKGMLEGMKRVGEKFRDNKIFLPEVLIAAKAMNNSMELLKPYFQSGELKLKGKIVLGTVAGDLHDIGKNIVKMVLNGGGWEVIDLGVNVSSEKFLNSVRNNDIKIVGMSALLTTTMMNMGQITQDLKNEFSEITVIVGGAPLSDSFAKSINADHYFPDPQSLLNYLNSNFSN